MGLGAGSWPIGMMKHDEEPTSTSQESLVKAVTLTGKTCPRNLEDSEANSVVENSACKALDVLGPKGSAKFRCRGYDVVPIAPRWGCG